MTGPQATVLAPLIASLPGWASYLETRSTRTAVDRHARAQKRATAEQTADLKDHITRTAAAPPAPAPPGRPDPEEEP